MIVAVNRGLVSGYKCAYAHVALLYAGCNFDLLYLVKL